MNSNPICFVAGKSGGHIIPCLTLRATHFQNQQAIFFSTNASLDATILKNSDIAHHIALPLEFKKPNRFINLACQMFGLFKSWCISLFYLNKYKPSAVISTGGMCAIPVCLAAWLLRIPFTLYELNAIPGKAVMLLSPLAQKIVVCFPEAREQIAKAHCVVESYPLRFMRDYELANMQTIRDRLQLSSDKKTILVLGGSQGSLFLNQAIELWLTQHQELHNQIQIIHQTGKAHLDSVTQFYKNVHIPALIFDYTNDMAPYYLAANLVIGRAGAGTLFETLYFKKPMIIIPLEIQANDHQLYNAQAMVHNYPTIFGLVRQADLGQNSDPLNLAIQVRLGL